MNSKPFFDRLSFALPQRASLTKIGLLLFFLLTGLLSEAQTYRQLVKFADENYTKGDYFGASVYYRKALDIDSLDIQVLWKYTECLRLYNEYELAEYYYDKIYYREGGKIFPLSAYHLATMQKYNGKYKEATRTFKLVSRQYSRDKKSFYYQKARQEIKSCSFAMRMRKDTLGFSIRNAGSPINTFDSEFGAMRHDTVLYFSSLRADKMNEELQVFDPQYKIKIYSSESPSTPKALDTTVNNAAFHNANGSFSPDGKRFYFVRCDDGYRCRILYSRFENKRWSTPQEAGKYVNREGYTSTQPMVAQVDTREILFFSSDMPGGQGKMDIWYAEIANGIPGKPVNMGKKVNSIDDEISPFYDPVDKLLYFSSSWHEGLGGFDIFKVSGAPANPGSPINLGYPINTSWNDMYYASYPLDRTALLTSNRKGSLYKKGPTCCNDIYQVEFPNVENTEDETPYQSLEDLNKYLPVTLYFHNDEPNPRSNDTTTRLNYMTTYQAYSQLTEKYKDEYSKGLNEEKKAAAREDIENFFMDYADKGVADLEIFTQLLLQELEKGQKIELTIKGFASPLAKTDYNVRLTQRRIASLINYLREYEGGVFLPYLDGNAANGGRLYFVKIPFGEYTASNLVSDNFHDQKNSVYSRAAALERKIEIQTVQRAGKEEKIPELRMDREVQDLGKIPQGNPVNAVFTLKNTGDADLLIENVLIQCRCLSADYPKTAIAPGETAKVTLTFYPEGYQGKQVHSVTLVSNGFPPNKRLIVTAEVE